MKLSKKLLALGLSVGIVMTSVVPAFAASSGNQSLDSLEGLQDVFNSIENKTYTAEEKAKIMADAENIVDRWDDVIYSDGVLKLRDSRGKYYLVEYTGEVDRNGGVEYYNSRGVSSSPYVWDAKDGLPIITATQYMTPGFLNKFYKDYGTATNRLSDYEDKMNDDFEFLFHELHFDALGKDRLFRIYEKENTNVTDIGDTLVETTVFDLLDMWTHEGSLLNQLNDSLSRAALGKSKGASTSNSGSNAGASVSSTPAPAANNNTTTTTTSTTTCVTTTPVATTTTTTAPVATKATGQGLPLANTSTNYGNVMALGLGAMVVALGVFAYSKKVTA